MSQVGGVGDSTINVQGPAVIVPHQPKSRVVYVLMAVLIPLFSPCLCGIVPPVHNFYSGHTTRGLVQLSIWLGVWVASMALDLVFGTITLGVAAIVGIVLWCVMYLGMFAWCIIDAITVDKDSFGVPMT